MLRAGWRAQSSRYFFKAYLTALSTPACRCILHRGTVIFHFPSCVPGAACCSQGYPVDPSARAGSSCSGILFRLAKSVLGFLYVHKSNICPQIVPYLICMSTDHEQRVSHTADKELQDIEKKYPGFIHMKLMKGIMLSFRLQQLLQKGDGEKSVMYCLL